MSQVEYAELKECTTKILFTISPTSNSLKMVKAHFIIAMKTSLKGRA